MGHKNFLNTHDQYQDFPFFLLFFIKVLNIKHLSQKLLLFNSGHQIKKLNYLARLECIRNCWCWILYFYIFWNEISLNELTVLTWKSFWNVNSNGWSNMFTYWKLIQKLIVLCNTGLDFNCFFKLKEKCFMLSTFQNTPNSQQ